MAVDMEKERDGDAFDFQLVARLSHVNKASNLAKSGESIQPSSTPFWPPLPRLLAVFSSVRMINGWLDKWKLYELH